MANPQLEDGYTKIANELLQRLMEHYLSPNQWQIVLCIIRRTYGYQKKVDRIANFQIVADTKLCKAVVSRNLKRLEDMKVIVRDGKSIGLQKDWEQWEKLAEQSTIEKVSSIVNQNLLNSQPKLAEQSTKVSSPAVTQKKKETIQKKLYKRKYGQFQNVLLTDDEYEKLKEKFNHRTDELIEALSLGIESKGYKYKSHYAAILSWNRRDAKGKSRGLPKNYTPQRDYQD